MTISSFQNNGEDKEGKQNSSGILSAKASSIFHIPNNFLLQDYSVSETTLEQIFLGFARSEETTEIWFAGIFVYFKCAITHFLVPKTNKTNHFTCPFHVICQRNLTRVYCGNLFSGGLRSRRGTSVSPRWVSSSPPEIRGISLSALSTEAWVGGVTCSLLTVDNWQLGQLERSEEPYLSECLIFYVWFHTLRSTIMLTIFLWGLLSWLDKAMAGTYKHRSC